MMRVARGGAGGRRPAVLAWLLEKGRGAAAECMAVECMAPRCVGNAVGGRCAACWAGG